MHVWQEQVSPRTRREAGCSVGQVWISAVAGESEGAEYEEASVKTGIMRRSWKVSVTHHTLCVNVLSWSMLPIPSPHTTLPPCFMQKPLVTQLPAGIRGSRFQCHSASLGITPNLQKQRCVLTSSNLRFYSFPAMIILLRDIWKPVTAICGCNLICHQRKKNKNTVFG